MKVKALAGLILLLACQQAQAASGVGVSVDTMFVGIGKGENDTRGTTTLYGVRGFTEFHPNWRVNYGLSGTVLNGFVVNVPVSIAYMPLQEYRFHLRPHLFAGVEPFYANFPDFNGFKFFGHVGLAIDYVFDNRWYINVGTKVYINDSFFRETVSNFDFNTGVVAVFGSAGIKY